jgi:hypothetical protein
MLQLTSKTEEVEVMVLLKHNRIRFENQPGLGRAHSTNAINTCNLKRFSVSYKLNFKSWSFANITYNKFIAKSYLKKNWFNVFWASNVRLCLYLFIIFFPFFLSGGKSLHENSSQEVSMVNGCTIQTPGQLTSATLN